MHITEKGQVTIPAHYREQYGFLPHTEVEFVERNGELVLKKAASTEEKAEQLRNAIRSLRGTATRKLTAEQVMQMTRGEE